MRAFKEFEHMRTLEVTLRLDGHLGYRRSETDFLQIEYESITGAPRYYLKESVCEEHVIGLYKTLLEDSVHPSIESVKVIMQTNNQFNEWVFEVISQSHDGKRFQIQKDFSKANPKLSTGYDPFG